MTELIRTYSTISQSVFHNHWLQGYVNRSYSENDSGQISLEKDGLNELFHYMDLQSFYCVKWQDLSTVVRNKFSVFQMYLATKSIFLPICLWSVAQLYPALCDPVNCSTQASLSFTNSQSLLKFMSIELVILPNHLTICHLLLLCLPSFPASGSFGMSQFFAVGGQSISPSNEYSGLIYFRIDWFDLLGVQGTLKSLLQHHNLKASILQHSAFLMVQFSHPFMTTGEIIALYTDLCWQSEVSAL